MAYVNERNLLFYDRQARARWFHLFTDSENRLIILVDVDGSVRWSHDYGSELVYTQIVADNIYLIDVTEGGQYALDCIGLDGIWKSTRPCPPIFSFIHGDEGRVYASDYANNNYTITISKEVRSNGLSLRTDHWS